MSESDISVTTFAITFPSRAWISSSGCVFKISIVRLIPLLRFCSAFSPFWIIFPSSGKKLLVVLREYSCRRAFSIKSQGGAIEIIAEGAVEQSVTQFGTSPGTPCGSTLGNKTPLAFFMFNIGGLKSEEVRSLHFGVGTADVHRHSRDSRSPGRPAADYRKCHARAPLGAGKGIDAGGKHSFLLRAPSALLRADPRFASGRHKHGFEIQANYAYHLSGYVGRPFGCRARQHEFYEAPKAEIRHQGSHARPSSGSGRIGLVSIRSESLYQRAAAPRAGHAFSIKKKAWHNVIKTSERSAL